MPTASIVAWAPEESWSPMTWHPARRRTARGSSAAGTTSSAPNRRASALLVGIAGADDDAHPRAVADEAGRSRRGPSCRHRGRRRAAASAVAIDGVAAAIERGVDAGGERLDEHGSLVRDVVADRVELGVVGDELGRPPAAGGAAEPGLDSRLEHPGREVGVVVAVARRGAVERRREAALPRGRAPVRGRRGGRRRARRRPRGRVRTGS